MTDEKVKHYELFLTGEVYTIQHTDKHCKAKFSCNMIDIYFDINDCPDLRIGDQILLKVKYTKGDIFVKTKN